MPEFVDQRWIGEHYPIPKPTIRKHLENWSEDRPDDVQKGTGPTGRPCLKYRLAAVMSEIDLMVKHRREVSPKLQAARRRLPELKKKYEVIVEDDVVWYSTAKTMAYLDAGYGQLDYWTKKPELYLNGEKLERKDFEREGTKLPGYYRKSQLDQIKRAKEAIEAAGKPTAGGSSSELAAYLGVKVKNIKRVAEGATKRMLPCKNGTPKLQYDCDQETRERLHEKRNPTLLQGRILLDTAATTLDVPRSTVNSWGAMCPWLSGRRGLSIQYGDYKSKAGVIPRPQVLLSQIVEIQPALSCGYVIEAYHGTTMMVRVPPTLRDIANNKLRNAYKNALSEGKEFSKEWNYVGIKEVTLLVERSVWDSLGLPWPPAPTQAPPNATPEAVPSVQDASPKKKRGRPRGSVDGDVQRRTKELLESWKRKEHGTNKAEYGRFFDFHRSDATKIINGYERRK